MAKDELVCIVCGVEDGDEPGNPVFYRNGEPICQACSADLDVFLECGFPPSEVKHYK